MFAFILITLCLSNTAAFGIWPTVNKFPIFQYLENFYEKNQFLPSKSILLNPKVNTFNITDDDKYQSQWYMIGRPTDFPFRVPRKVNIWGRSYVVWKNTRTQFVCLSDTCSHGGDSLSNGYITDNCVVCPQHQSCFNEDGQLIHSKTTYFGGDKLYEIPCFQVAEKNNMLYLNTYEYAHNATISYRDFSYVNTDFRPVFIESSIHTHPTILMENSLDVVHILFAKLFTNKNSIEPDHISDMDIHNPLHYSVKYTYQAGQQSVIQRLFDSDTLVISSEIITPFTTISRVLIDNKELVFETNILPISQTKSRIFIHCYRNFSVSYGGDKFINEVIQKVLDVYRQMSLYTC